MDGKNRKQKRILTVQDISCIGQCSLTVALPVISVFGIETAVIPSAVLSTHTGCWKNFTFRDLSDDIPAIIRHWSDYGETFDGLYTGYIGNDRQFGMINEIRKLLVKPGAPVIIDPAMADNGRLYAGFDDAFPAAMRDFIAGADIVLPNITEAALMTGLPYRDRHTPEYVESLVSALRSVGAKSVVLTGVSFEDTEIGICVWDEEKGTFEYRFEERVAHGSHGTGDVFASAFVGYRLCGKSIADAGTGAARFVRRALLNTDGESHAYGVNFESVLHTLFENG